jgi:DNA polymerase-4
VTLKIKYYDFKLITRSVTLPEPIYKSGEIFNTVRRLLEKTEAGKKKIRLAGISMSNFGKKEVKLRPDEGPLLFP